MVEILSVTHINKRGQPGKTKNVQIKNEGVFICLTLRQWALLFSFLIFISEALFIACSVLGTLHIKEVWHLLEADIKEEHAKSELDGIVRHISPNEEKLRASESFMISMSKFMGIALWSGIINLILEISMIYGIISKKHKYVLPWLVSSIITFFMIVAFVILALTGFVRYICLSTYTLLWFVPLAMAYIYMWRVICKYYISINPRFAEVSAEKRSFEEAEPGPSDASTSRYIAKDQVDLMAEEKTIVKRLRDFWNEKTRKKKPAVLYLFPPPHLVRFLYQGIPPRKHDSCQEVVIEHRPPVMNRFAEISAEKRSLEEAEPGPSDASTSRYIAKDQVDLMAEEKTVIKRLRDFWNEKTRKKKPAVLYLVPPPNMIRIFYWGLPPPKKTDTFQEAMEELDKLEI